MTNHGAWDVRLRAAIGDDTAENMRESAVINENDFEVGSAIAECQRRYARLIELSFELARELEVVRCAWCRGLGQVNCAEHCEWMLVPEVPK